MNKIKVEIDLIKDYPLNFSHNLATFESWCIGKLKDAGIPIKGILVFRGLEQGILTRYEDFNHPHTIYFVWENTKA